MILFPFGIGIIIGIILISKLVNYLLKKYSSQTYFGIYGIIIASIVSIVIPLINEPISKLLIGGLLMIIGIIFTYKLGGEK